MHSDRTQVSIFTKRSRAVFAVAAASVAAFALLACGNNYRPVVSSINPVGPAGQPTKYAIAISSTGASTPGLVTQIDYSGDTIVNTTLIGINPQYFQLAAAGYEGYTINGDNTFSSFSISTSLLQSEVLQSTLLPNSFSTVTPNLNIFSTGAVLYTTESGRNAVAALSGLPPSVQQELPTGADTTYIVGTNAAPRIYALAQGSSPAAVPGVAVPIETTSNTTDAAIPVGLAPTFGLMSLDARRAYILNKGSNNVTVINAQTNALDTFCSPLTAAGGCVSLAITGYSITGNVITFTTATQTALTAGQSVSLNGFPTSTFLNNTPLQVSATGLTPTSFQAPFTHAAVATTSETGVGTLFNSTIPVGAAPIWADFAPTLSEVLVANAGSSTSLCAGGIATGCGSVTIINIPLCSSSTVTSNPNCDTSNPVDAIGFGQVIANIPVGINPVMIAVLQDGTQAYVANAGNSTTAGSVSVINLNTNTVVATIPAGASTNENDTIIHGHPNWIAVTTGTPTGKVYITAADSTDITILRTDIDAVQTHLTLQGTGVSVRVTQP